MIARDLAWAIPNPPFRPNQTPMSFLKDFLKKRPGRHTCLDCPSGCDTH